MTQTRLVSFGRETCGDLAAGLRREWLVTNGLGGYASGTLTGVNTRRYHGLLVAALMPPVGRTVLVGGMVEHATYDGRRFALSTHEYGDSTVDGHGYRYVESFHLEGTLPVWRYALGDALIERRVWMAHGANTTYVTYEVVRASRDLELHLVPLVTYRDFHSLTSGQGWRPDVEAQPRGAVIRPFDGARAFHLLGDGGQFTPGGDWYWNFRHREEAARGLDDRGDLYAPGAFTVTLAPGERFSLALSVEDRPDTDSRRSLARERERQDELLQRAGVAHAEPVLQQLVLAADQFIVERAPSPSPSPAGRERGVDLAEGRRPMPTAETDHTNVGINPSVRIDASPLSREAGEGSGEGGRTIIAGYHWFNDWGRDTMIALPGLTLATGRYQDAADILRTFAAYVADGLLPNNFPDSSGAIPGYNTVDATLWYVLAIRAYHEATGDESLVDDLLPVLRDIVDHHQRGTRYGIGVDPVDGLLRSGEPGVQLTWMDAKVGDWVVTPRTGKAVEINALWYNALRTIAAFLRVRGIGEADRYDALAEQVRLSFRARFGRPGQEHLADVVDTPDGDDHTLRPNQIFALSLPYPLLDGADAEAALGSVGRSLLASHGLRSLSPDDPAYRGDYGGDQLRRDGGYHQGPIWTWLIGAYVEAHYRVHGDREAARALLQPFEHHLRDAGLGTVSEILEGDAPHLPRGCIAQAWGVSEVLRVWRMLEADAEKRPAMDALDAMDCEDA